MKRKKYKKNKISRDCFIAKKKKSRQMCFGTYLGSANRLFQPQTDMFRSKILYFLYRMTMIEVLYNGVLMYSQYK